MRTGLTNNRNVLTATTHRSTATPVYLQYPKYVAGVEHALHMAYKHLLNEQGCNIDLCGYPNEEEEILDPMDTIREYQERRTALNAEIDKVLAELEALLPGGVSE